MISERIAARSFESIWRTRLPMLTPAFMNAFNRQFVKPIVRGGKPLPPVSASSSVSDAPDLVAELGIQIAKSAVEGRIPVEDVARHQPSLHGAWLRSLELVSRYEGRQPDPNAVQLNADDTQEAVRLAGTLSAFLDQFDDDAYFGPLVPGAGALSRCEADLAVGRELVEVKTVSRRFRSLDLRQLLVYLALDWAGGEPRWTRGCLVNPRRAEWADFEVDWLTRRLAGRAAVDVLADLVDAFGSTVELETSSF